MTDKTDPDLDRDQNLIGPTKDVTFSRLQAALLAAAIFMIVGFIATHGAALAHDQEHYLDVHELEANPDAGDDGEQKHGLAYNFSAEEGYEATIEIRLVQLDNNGNRTTIETWRHQTYISEGHRQDNLILDPPELQDGRYQYEVDVTIHATRLVDKEETYRTEPFIHPSEEESDGSNSTDSTDGSDGSDGSEESDGSNSSNDSEESDQLRTHPGEGGFQ